MGLGMLAFECYTYLLRADMRLWESHFVTVVFSSSMATLLTYFVFRRNRPGDWQLAADLAQHDRTLRELQEAEEKFKSLADRITDSYWIKSSAADVGGFSSAEPSPIPLAGSGGKKNQPDGNELEIEESKRFLQSALDALSAHIGILDEQGRIIAVNEAWSRFAGANGLPGGNYGVGENYLEVCQQASGDCAAEAAAVAHGIREVISQRVPEFQLEYPCHSPTAERWFVVRVTRFTGDGPVRVVVAHEDVTGRRRDADDLTASQELLRQFIRHTPAAIAMLDNQMRYLQTSERWIQDYHLAGVDIIGKSHYEVFPDAPERWKAIHQRVLAGAVERCDEDAFPRADGTTDWLQWEVRPWLNAGGGIGGLIFFTQVITGRKRADEELRWKTALLEAQVDSYAVGILVVNSAGGKILQNQRMTELWKIPPEIADSDDDHAQVEFGRTKFPELFKARVVHLYAHPDECSEDEIELIDGTVLDRYSAPVMGKDGHHYGRIWTFTDITERRQAEAETALLHLKLLELSRQAGMAEVATSVLHNVGNVLNSVNVSCAVIAEKVRKSRIASVAKTADLLRAHAGDLASFIASDPMGQKLPEFVGKLASRLNVEQESILGEIQSLVRNVEHIKEIVDLQQNHARVTSFTEMVQVIDLIEESLHLNVEGLSRHDIRLVREFDEVPFVTVEKHRVLQILVNLICNAKQSCIESAKAEKQLTLRLTESSGRVRIAVIDNGMGIRPENLTRVFANGFTTRKDGHGFGLHSAVLAAQEMGGALTAHSDGPGKGAIFTLELPIDRT